MKLLILPAIVILFSASTLFSQETKQPTMESIRSFIKERNYREAEKQLKSYYLQHSEDVEVNWLYAQIAHWNQNNSLATKLFLKAIVLSPKNIKIQLDYARMLYENGKLKKIEKVLNGLTNDPTTQAEALIMIATISYWKGEISRANETIAEIQKLYPNTKITESLSKDIAATTALYFKSQIEYQADSQPLQYYAQKFEIEQYRSGLIHPIVTFTNANFVPEANLVTSKISNQFLFASLGFSATISSGIYKNFSDKSSWIGGLILQQKIATHTMLKIGFDKIPCTATQSSTTLNLIQNNIVGEVNYDNPKLFSLHTGITNQYFSDRNMIQTCNAWIISKPLSIGFLKVQYGYGFNYSEAKKNTFVSKESLETVITNYNITSAITGIYYPYFTPKNQTVHASLLVLNYTLNKKINIIFKGNYGFYAHCQNPFIYLNNSVANATEFRTSYYNKTFTTIETSGEINYLLTDQLTLKSNYNHQETFFYNRNNFNLGLNYRF
jgi:hypothetical protein